MITPVSRTLAEHLESGAIRPEDIPERLIPAVRAELGYWRNYAEEVEWLGTSEEKKEATHSRLRIKRILARL